MNQRTDREAELCVEILKALNEISYAEAGLILLPEKIKMVQSRLRPRLRACGLRDFPSYLSLIKSPGGATEVREMISALTTNVSHFFRESHHFEVLGNTVLPHALEAITEQKRFRIWSAGCSQGQEAFSVAMYLLDKAPHLAQADFRILATDIDPKVIAFGRQGIYPVHMAQGVPEPFKQKFMRALKVGPQPAFQMIDEVRRLVSFRELNLLKQWPMRHKFDVIFCRNVVIYFDAITQDALWPRFCAALKPTGRLFLGHSERVAQPQTMGLKCVGPTTYARSESQASTTVPTFKTKGLYHGIA